MELPSLLSVVVLALLLVLSQGEQQGQSLRALSAAVHLPTLAEAAGAVEGKHETEPSSGILKTIYSGAVSPRTTRGLLIDGGSGGSRLHVYHWAPRVFDTVPPPISFPKTNDQFTGRMGGGIQECWQEGQTEVELEARVRAHLLPLLDFARRQLRGHEADFAFIPIWLKATGGARELSSSARLELLTMIRKLMTNDDFCPFYFRDEMARVISGEEEAVFSWACMNFLKGNLVPDSQGLGAVSVKHAAASYGTLDLGGSSTQIAFFLPSEDYMEGLYKLQIGGQKHWNVYAKSFLQFGINSARRRSFRLLAATAVNAQHADDSAVIEQYDVSETPSFRTEEEDAGLQPAEKLINEPGKTAADALAKAASHRLLLSTRAGAGAGAGAGAAAAVGGAAEAVAAIDKKQGHVPSYSIRNPCFHSGYTEKAAGIVLDESNPAATTVDLVLHGPEKQETGERVQLNLCMQELKPLMEKDANAYCNTVYHGECSIGGAYQPALPTGEFRHFFATSSYKMPWLFLRLQPNTTLDTFADSAGKVCAMNYMETAAYVHEHGLVDLPGGEKMAELNKYFCFMASYTLVLLQDGYGFSPDDTITVLDKVNNYATGWPLGAILHELNNLPWELKNAAARTPYGRYILCGLIGVLVGAATAFTVSRELNMSNTGSDAQLQRRTAAGGGDLEMKSSGSGWKGQIKQLNPFGGGNKAGYQAVPDE